MIYPSVDLLKAKVDSKYTLVTIAAKRARELQEKNNEILTNYRSVKSVGKALEEVAAGALINIKADESIIYEDEV